MGRHSSGIGTTDGDSRDPSPSGRVRTAEVGPTTGARRAITSTGDHVDGFGFDHRTAGDGRRGAWIWILVALLVIAALVSGFLIWRAMSGGCSDRTKVSIASDQAMTAALRSVAQQVSTDSCFDFAVDGVPGASVPGLMTSGDKAPDLWLADSQAQARRVTDQVRRDLVTVSPSVATSPTVVVGKKVPDLSSWSEVMKLPDLRSGSPLDTSTGDAPIIGALAEVDAGKLDSQDLTSAMSVLAIQQNNARLANDNEGTRLNLANSSDIPVVTTEQQYTLFSRTHPGTELKAKVPADGTVMLDYPLVSTAPAARADDAKAAGQALVAGLQSEAGRKALADAGYRAPDGTGVGEKMTALTLKDPNAVDKALRQWQVLGVPIRTLVLEDVSGSMNDPAGSSTRGDLLVNASMQGLKLFPNNTEIGGWAFGIDKGGPGRDYLDLAPIRRLDAAAANGGTHRDELAAVIRKSFATLVGGGTGLYDSVLAAFKRVQDTYDPNYSNSVIVMTDGQNDDPNSITLPALISQLKQLEDPARPVLVLTIGISQDADRNALKQIADATGGTSYVATTPSDIQSVFVNAIQARVAAAGR